MLRPLSGFILAAVLLTAGPCLADTPAQPAVNPKPPAPTLELPARPVCVPLPPLTA